MAIPFPRSKTTGLRHIEQLENREVPAVSAITNGTDLTITGTGTDRLDIYLDQGQLVVADRVIERIRTPAAGIANINIQLNGSNNILRVSQDVTASVNVIGSAGGSDYIRTGGGAATVTATGGHDIIAAGNGAAVVNSGNNQLDILYRLKPGDTFIADNIDLVQRDSTVPPPGGVPDQPQATMTASDVGAILDRASAASQSTDGIIAIVDRNGRILGVRLESGVAPEITNNPQTLAFAVDGAVSLARTGAFFGNNQAPLTSRTVQFISQSTITQREVESNPNIKDPNSTVAGPGYIAPVGINGHFPPGVPLTPQVDLFAIEHTNRDSSYIIDGNGNKVTLPGRFNIDPSVLGTGASGSGPNGAKVLFAPDSYGTVTGINPLGQNRGIATLPGGIPLYKDGQVVGGIGVFYPGKTGYATEENSPLSSTYDPKKPDRTLEAEYVAFVAAGGAVNGQDLGLPFVPTIAGVNLPTGYGLPVQQFGNLRIDLVGIQLDVLGPGGLNHGRDVLLNEAATIGQAPAPEGKNLPVNTSGTTLLNGLPVADGYIVPPRDGVGITKDQVQEIITTAMIQASKTRAAIRLPFGERAKFVYAVADRDGNIVGLYREPDATVFSIDVAVAKARNANYYADASKLQAIDQIPGIPAGTAFTARTFRYAAEPRFPEGIDGNPPGPFSQLLDGGADPFTGLQVGPRLPASAYQSVLGYDSFNPSTNFRDKTNSLNRDGIVFFPGSAPLYSGGKLIGGFGVSGDGVDQDDVTTAGGSFNFGVPQNILRADQVSYRNINLPYQKFNRNPEG